jgi:hypothetical protein
MMRNNLTLTLIIASFTMLASISFGQSDKWTLLHEEQGIQFYGIETYCKGEDDGLKPSFFSHLRIVNANAREVKLIFGYAMEFEEGCSGCDQDSEFMVSVSVPANSTIEGSCGDQTGPLTRIIRNANLPGGWTYRSTKIVFPIID